ncbi:anthrone oxygenase family protein [Actinosynnema sp. NPDC053489]|uniref:anthrone oxygenase family protein n=1 Tax=Actinosynnema sp. NPDC053489 TaxID=3363916 RepID=UPI0037C94B6F
MTTQEIAAARAERWAARVALLSTGLLAGTFGYGAVNLVTAFHAVPLDVRLTFHSALMRVNGPVVQPAMAVAAAGSIALAALARGRARAAAVTAGVLVATSFLVTRFGNVPINARIRQWAVTAPPADHAEVLRRREAFNAVRTVTALVAFLLVTWIATRSRAGGRAGQNASAIGVSPLISS